MSRPPMNIFKFGDPELNLFFCHSHLILHFGGNFKKIWAFPDFLGRSPWLHVGGFYTVYYINDSK